MRIVLDAMGSDTCPDPEVEAAVIATQEFGDELFLVGDVKSLIPKLNALSAETSKVRVIDAPDAITMEDKDLQVVLKAKRKDSKTSMAVGIDLIKSGEADAFVTAGNTGGAFTTAYFRLGMLSGVERPALSALFPVRGGKCVVLDIGANPECKAEHMAQFAVMGSIYSNAELGVISPRVGLLSNGEEAKKGNQLIKDTYPLLEASDLNFIGNVEPKELFGGEVDVVVTDGFTGNVLTKSSEAVAKMIKDLLKEELFKGLRTKLGALLAAPAFDVLSKLADPEEIGAAPLLGINGLVFVGHGRSNARALVSAIRATRHAVKSDLLAKLSNAIETSLGSGS